MPLVRIPEPFDHPEWVFELKHDGFRTLAYVEGHQRRLVSRRGHEFRKWDVLCVEIAHSVRTMHAVLDGEIVCLDPEGRSQSYPLLFRRDWPYLSISYPAGIACPSAQTHFHLWACASSDRQI